MTAPTATNDRVARQSAVELIRQTLTADDLTFDEPEPGSFVVNLPGDHRLVTACWLIVSNHGVRIEAFVIRRPDENVEAVYRWLLRRNAKSYLIGWSIDDAGDVYLTGHLPLAAVSADELDRLLGVVLDYSDSSFNFLLELGFGSAIRREWAWRTSRGESVANLAAFSAFLNRPDAAAGANPA